MNNDIVELTAEITGDCSLIKSAGFMIGTSMDKLSYINGSIEGTSIKAYLAGLSAGTYCYKAIISNGTQTKESEINTFTID